MSWMSHVKSDLNASCHVTFEWVKSFYTQSNLDESSHFTQEKVNMSHLDGPSHFTHANIIMSNLDESSHLSPVNVMSPVSCHIWMSPVILIWKGNHVTFECVRPYLTISDVTNPYHIRCHEPEYKTVQDNIIRYMAWHAWKSYGVATDSRID